MCLMEIKVKIVCKKCGEQGIKKNGFTQKGKQRYRCLNCGFSFLLAYDSVSYSEGFNKKIIVCVRQSVGIRGISRLLEISPTTVIKKIREISKALKKPEFISMHQIYEMDELCTYVKSKNNRPWVAYALNRQTKEVVDFVVGKRNNSTLKKVVNTLLFSQAKEIRTDKLPNYRSLIPNDIHHVCRYNINHIERENLNLRTHLKRLSRRTICFSKSLSMLSACLTIYFWG